MLRNLRSMSMHQTQAGITIWIIRIGLAAFLLWTGVLQLESRLAFGAGLILVGVLILLGILSRIAAIAAIVVLALPIVIYGFAELSPAVVLSVIVAVAILLAPRN